MPTDTAASTAPAPLPPRFEIAGRPFRQVEERDRTVLHDAYVTDHSDAAGLGDIAASTAPAPLPPRFEIAGRPFRQVEERDRTVLHDAYVTDHSDAAGLGDIGAFILARQGADAVRLSTDLVLAVARSGRFGALVAGLIVPDDGGRWTAPRAAEVARWAEEVTDPEGKALLWRVLNEGILGFFVSAAVSLLTSLRSSYLPEVVPAGTASGSEAAATSDASPTSSAPSPATTPADTAP